MYTSHPRTRLCFVYLQGDVPGHVNVAPVLVHPDLSHPQSISTHVGRQVLCVGLVGTLNVGYPGAGQDLYTATTLPHLKKTCVLSLAAKEKVVSTWVVRHTASSEQRIKSWLWLSLRDRNGVNRKELQERMATQLFLLLQFVDSRNCQTQPRYHSSVRWYIISFYL